jgi:thiamine biosynthesis lipoprotein
VEQALERVNQSMSTYRDDAEIMAVNRAPANEALALSADFIRVLETGLAIGSASGGAYDVTVGPLVRLWGFGPGGAVDSAPAEDAIAQARDATGQGALELDVAAGTLLKRAPRELDFSSIAKGYAIDLAAEAITEVGVSDFLFEIGGEMRVSGNSPRGDRWRVAIEQPDPTLRAVARAIPVSDASVATSGDYRNYFEVDGVRYSHSIDPRTGYPVRHDLVSVTVVHESAMVSDGWATALVILGMPAAREVAEQQSLAVYFIQRDGEDFIASHSSAFEPYLEGEDA